MSNSTFTGSSRRPRNINLSGRGGDPFASTGFGTSTSLSGRSTGGKVQAVATAQSERDRRAKERAREHAARNIQRVWRGRRGREEWWGFVREELQRAINSWEEFMEPKREEDDKNPPEQLSDYVDLEDEQVTERLILIIRWTNRLPQKVQGDELKLFYEVTRVFEEAFHAYAQRDDDNAIENFLTKIQAHVGLAVLSALAHRFFNHSRLHPSLSTEQLDDVADISHNLFAHGPDPLADLHDEFVQMLITDLPRAKEIMIIYSFSVGIAIVTAPEDGGKIFSLLGHPKLHEFVDMEDLVKVLPIEETFSLFEQGKVSNNITVSAGDVDAPIWAVANCCHLLRLHGDLGSYKAIHMVKFLYKANSGRRLDLQNRTPYIQQQLAHLPTKDVIYSIFGAKKLDYDDACEILYDLSNFVVHLTVVFPHRADDVRMWVYLYNFLLTGIDNPISLPAVRAFSTRLITDSDGSFMWGPGEDDMGSWGRIWQPPEHTSGWTDSDWEWDEPHVLKMVCFLDIYLTALKVMDDNDFMYGTTDADPDKSWARKSALSIEEVRHLAAITKEMAFQLTTAGKASSPPKQYARPRALLKEIAVGILRALYERDSRLKFMKAAGAWEIEDLKLRPDFAEHFVMEENSRLIISSEEESDEDEVDDDPMDLDHAEDTLVGNTHVRQIIRQQKLLRERAKEAKARSAQQNSPLVSILRDLPFFIPFETRVEIFREFIYQDQFRRRGGTTNPDEWRQHMMMRSIQSRRDPFSNFSLDDFSQSDLAKHSASVRREHIFEDAFSAFRDLGDGLKEPIQITFRDKFDEVEAGIDGGGVTKEFLTSVTNEAFKNESNIHYFVQSDKHLLYPNPLIMDEQDLILSKSQADEATKRQETVQARRGLLQRYEFMGRLIGKCLYEGILVDVRFAPFFVSKWALFGGSGLGAKDSGYRANINDLAGLDSELYQGLLKLKNFRGDVESLGADFTTTDVVSIGEEQGDTKTLTRPLIPNGENTPVTNENRLIYIQYVARYRLVNQPAQQTKAFLQGLSTMIEPFWLSMFSQAELQTLLSGHSGEIDVSDLRRNTEYSGIYTIGTDGQEHPTIKHFWEVMTEFSDEKRRKVLKYVTSTPRGPLLGFSKLNPRFSIRDSGRDQSRLPSTSTCVNLLKLPVYQSKNLLREKLELAIESGDGFWLS